MDDLINAMKVVLGTTFALYIKTHAYHWNVEGPTFPQLHALFGDQYTNIWASVDDIAEQIRQMDAYAPVSMERFLQLSQIESETRSAIPARDMLLTLVADHETMIEVLTNALHLAEQADRQGLMNFLADRIEKHSKMRWMLRATAKQVGGTETKN